MDHFELYLVERINFFLESCKESKNRGDDDSIVNLHGMFLDELLETLTVYRTKYKIWGGNFLNEL